VTGKQCLRVILLILILGRIRRSMHPPLPSGLRWRQHRRMIVSEWAKK
jgi:hypothetical protein